MNKKISPGNNGIPHDGFIGVLKAVPRARQLFTDFFLIV